jgi:hypothetical protein
MSIRYLHLVLTWLKTIATGIIPTGIIATAHTPHMVGLSTVTSICILLAGLSPAIITETKQMVLFQSLKRLKHRSMLTKHHIGQW